MNFSGRLLPLLVDGVLLLGVGTAAVRWIWPQGAAGTGMPVPKLSTLAVRGKIAFNSGCAQCHGRHGIGTAKGPPLIHDFYNPGHHGDEAFFRAARRGVPQHHWRFGNMPPRPEVSDKQLAAIVRYIRELQEANGIVYRPHRM